jgi:putative hydroxymethylpyrimidine transport system substrate-binding protein
MKRILLALTLTAGLAWNSLALAEAPVTLMLDWFPNVDHLPIYVAEQRGFFAKQGVAVKILNPSDTADALKLAAAGKVDLAVSYEPQTLMAAGRGIEVRVVGRLIGHPLTTLMVLKASNITKPGDLSGRTIGYTVPGLMDVLMDAFAKINGITDYHLVNVGFSIAPALSAGRVDAVMGPFKTYETVTMAAEGLDTDFFELEKWGIPDYDELIFICGPKTLAAKRKAVQGFVRAIAQGLDAIATSPDAALADYFKALPEADKKVDYATGQACDHASWRAFADFALKHGLIERQVDVEALLPDLLDAE